MSHKYFPDCYFSSTEMFKKKALEKGAKLFQLPLSAKGPDKTNLTIDIAWFGEINPERCFMHIGGTHGVEGYTGAAVQHAYLDDELKIPEKSAIVLVHCLNPYGMIYGRRSNENNIDLNRNCHVDSTKYARKSPIYQEIHDLFLNESFGRIKLVNGLVKILCKYPLPEVKQAILGGQHILPEGFYFGGSNKAESVQLLEQFFEDNLSNTKKISVLELHTGMGRHGRDALYFACEPTDALFSETEKIFNSKLTPDVPTESIGFRTEGDIATGIPAVLPNSDVSWVVQEIGTYNPITIFRKARKEQLSFLKNGITYPNQVNIVPYFNPLSKTWRSKAINLGLNAFNRLISNENTLN